MFEAEVSAMVDPSTAHALLDAEDVGGRPVAPEQKRGSDADAYPTGEVSLIAFRRR